MLFRSLGINPPFVVEIGAVGIKGIHLSSPNRNGFPNQSSGEVFAEELHLRQVIRDFGQQTMEQIILKFLRQFYDLVGVDF